MSECRLTMTMLTLKVYSLYHRARSTLHGSYLAPLDLTLVVIDNLHFYKLNMYSTLTTIMGWLELLLFGKASVVGWYDDDYDDVQSCFFRFGSASLCRCKF